MITVFPAAVWSSPPLNSLAIIFSFVELYTNYFYFFFISINMSTCYRFTMFAELWKREFSFNSFTLKHDSPADFYKSQWQKGSRVNPFFLAYRWLMALAFLVTLLLSIVGIGELDQPASKRAKWLIYLTHWGYAICTIQSVLATYICTSVYIKQKRKEGMYTHIFKSISLIRIKLLPLCIYIHVGEY